MTQKCKRPPGRGAAVAEFDGRSEGPENTASAQKLQAVLARVEAGNHSAVEILRSRDGSRLTICPMTRTGDGPWRLAGAVPSVSAVLLDAVIEALQQARAALQRARS